MKKVIVNVEGMTCSACSNTVEKYLSKQDGIIDAMVNLVMGTASITYEGITLKDIARYIKESGYEYGGVFNPNKIKNQKKNKKRNLIIFGFLAVLTMYVSMEHMVKLWIPDFINMMTHPINYGVILLILAIVFIIYGLDIIKTGLKSLVHLSPNMDSLVSIGVISSFIYSLVNLILVINGDISKVHNLYFESVTMVIYFVKLGRYINNINEERTKDAIKDMVTITPKDATLLSGKTITIDEVKKGDILMCKPGEKIAVDGKVTKGTSHINEAFITGESKPKNVNKGDRVVAGALNIDGYLEYEALDIGPKSTISKIIHLVINATNTKVPIENMTDKISYYFCPAIILIACLTLIIYMLITHNINVALIHFVTVLVVACPCSLGLAVPLSIVVAIGNAAKKGILISDSEVLETAKDIDTVIFDKTGTLTKGTLTLSKFINYSNIDDDTILKITSSLESKSSHPIARVFDKYDKLDVEKFKNIEGHGLEGIIDNKKYYIGNSSLLNKLNIKVNDKDELKLNNLGMTTFYLTDEKNVLALFGTSDEIRKSSIEIVKSLKNKNIKTIMLTGDNEKAAKVVAENLGIDIVKANLEPNDKLKYIENLTKNNHKCMMVGDGINDAPSLTKATIGVTLNSSTDIAINSSGVTLMNDDLNKIMTLIDLSKKTIKNIKENLIWAFIYNICMIPISIGITPLTINPMMASIAMMLSSFTVIINALRLGRN